MRYGTFPRVTRPTGILVGIPDELEDACAETLAEGGLRVLKVRHVPAAAERIPVVMPQLVLVSTKLLPDELETIEERCVAVGAEVIRVGPEIDRATLMTTLKDAASLALAKALRQA